MKENTAQYRVSYVDRAGRLFAEATLTIAREVVDRDEYLAVRTLAEKSAPHIGRGSVVGHVSRVEVKRGDHWQTRCWAIPPRTTLVCHSLATAQPVGIETWPEPAPPPPGAQP